jgi:hypothetical protein
MIECSFKQLEMFSNKGEVGGWVVLVENLPHGMQELYYIILYCIILYYLNIKKIPI